METLKVRANEPGAVERCAEILKNGGLVAMPTETVYGLAANAFDERAVRGIFAAKGRPGDNPLIVHICALRMLRDIVEEIPESAWKLAAAYWPGPLTMILKKKPAVPDAASGGLPTVAVRFPAHPVARRLIELSGVPLAAPSANLSGQPSPTTFAHCVRDLDGRVDAILDGGPCPVGVESTVVTLAEEVPTLLRPGFVTLEELRQTLGRVEVSHAVLERLGEGETASSPGMKYKHYAPKAKVTLVKGPVGSYADYVNGHAGEGAFALCFDEDAPMLRVKAVRYGPRDSGQEQARRLFDALRELDDLGARIVFAHSPAAEGVGLAVYNRLVRAAGFDIVELS